MNTWVFFRVDATRETGGGHLSRCLALAECIAHRRPSVHFLCAPLASSYEEQIASRGYGIDIVRSGISLVEDEAGWIEADARGCAAPLATAREAKRILVVDHYSIDARWESLLRSLVDRIVVIDDLANRVHDCDVLVDQAYGEDGSRYAALVPKGCLGLFGSSYALLRPEFAEWRAKRARRTRIPRSGLVAHVFFGSEDHNGNTLRFTKLLLGVEPLREVRVAVSASFADATALEALRQDSGGRMSWQVVGPKMAEHMAGCDIAVGAPGHATWERACLGLPALYVAVSDHQVPILERLDGEGFCVFLGTDRSLSDDAFQSGCRKFLSRIDALEAMKTKAMSIVDGLGCTRVADSVLAGLSA